MQSFLLIFPLTCYNPNPFVVESTSQVINRTGVTRSVHRIRRIVTMVMFEKGAPTITFLAKLPHAYFFFSR